MLILVSLVLSLVFSEDTEGKEKNVNLFLPVFLLGAQTADLQNAKEKARYKQFVTNQKLDQWNSKL